MSVRDAQLTGAESAALSELAAFPLLDGLYGRRSRRFALGDESPTARSRTARCTSRCLSPSWSGCSC
jgi:hypothetical protein